MKMPKLKFGLPKFSKKTGETEDDLAAVANKAVLAKAPKDDGAGEAKPKGLKRFLPKFKGRAKDDPEDDPDAPADKAVRAKAALDQEAGEVRPKGLKRFLPGFKGRAKDDVADEIAAEAPEDDETSEDKRGGKRFLPKLRGKARVLVPVAAALVLAAGVGGGFSSGAW